MFKSDRLLGAGIAANQFYGCVRLNAGARVQIVGWGARVTGSDLLLARLRRSRRQRLRKGFLRRFDRRIVGNVRQGGQIGCAGLLKVDCRGQVAVNGAMLGADAVHHNGESLLNKHAIGANTCELTRVTLVRGRD